MKTRQAFLPRLLRWFGAAALLCIAFSWIVVLILRFVPPPTSAVMLERFVSQRLQGQSHFRIRQHWVPWKSISPYAPLAVMAGEDQKFPFHHGFDLESIQSAIDDADAGEHLRGASTISQQTAKNLFLWNGRSFVRKGLEAYFTVLLELTWPKQRILEVYLNLAEFGNGIYGVEAASTTYFHIAPARLDATQAARLAAVLPSPRRLHVDNPSAYVVRRTNWLLMQMDQLGGVAFLRNLKPATRKDANSVHSQQHNTPSHAPR
ncbi:MAG: monofunctional biosynthetic peptidoglycan transglycosylase [Rhodanobacter sp.]